MTQLINRLNWSTESSTKYEALVQILLNTQEKNTIVCVKNKSTASVLFNVLNLDHNIQHFYPDFKPYLNNNEINKQFNWGRCRLLVICFRVNHSLNADQVILFDEMWKEPFVPLDSQCQHIVISSHGQQATYDVINQRKKQTIQMIDSQVKNRIDLYSIEKNV